MKRRSLQSSIVKLLSLAAVFAFIFILFSFRGSSAATPAPESQTQEQIPEQIESSDRSVENDSTSTSKRLESVPLNNPNTQTSDLLNQTTFYSLADATVVQGNPSGTGGADFFLRTGYDSIIWDPPALTMRSFIFFYISTLPADQNIIGATLRVRLVGGCCTSASTTPVTTYRISSNWAESTVTWINAPTYGEAYGSQHILRDALGWYDFDVTNLVRGWYDGTYQNYGIMLAGDEFPGPSASTRYFSSRESNYYIPELVIQYEPKPFPPTIAGLPDQELLVNTSLDNSIDLWVYTNDPEDADADMSFTINNNPNPSAGVSLDSNRYIDINPANGWTGITNVAIEVMDTDGYSDLDSFQVIVFGERIYLPIVR